MSSEARTIDAQLDNARRTLLEFHAWRLENEDAWGFMEAFALDAAEQGKRIGGQELVEAARRLDFIDTSGKPTSINNSYAPIIVRWLIAKYPHLREHFELRHSIFDEFKFPRFRGGRRA